METAKKIAELIPQLTATRSSCETLQKASPAPILKSSNGEMAVSLYRDAEPSPAEIAVSMKRLQVAFPKMEPAFFNLLAERIMGNGFTSERLKDAVNHVLDNFQYKELNISDIIRFDRRVRLYTHNEVSRMVTEGKAAFSDFEIREIGGTYYRILRTDLERK